jgi:hypothetical protein
VNAAMPVMGAEPASDGTPWACLIVLDARQFSTRCRCCGWRSPLCAALTDAQTAFQTHACPSARSTLRRERQRCQAASGAGAYDASGWTRTDRLDPPEQPFGRHAPGGRG